MFKTSQNFLAPRYWPIWLVIGLLKLLIKLPYKTQLAIGRLIGRILITFPSKMRHTSKVNIALCFPELSENERKILLRKNFESIGIGVMETALGWWASDEKIKQLAHVQGFEHIKAALQKGKGVILCGAHFTTLEIVGRLVAQHIPCVVVYRPQKNLLLEQINRQALDKHYQRVLLREDVRGLLRCLKENLCVWYTPDVDAGIKNSVFVPFFGVMAASVTATPRYVKMTGATIIPAAFYRREDGSGYDLIAHPAVENFPTDNVEQDVAHINKILETAIRQQPAQYIWQYKRFKTRPAGEKRFY